MSAESKSSSAAAEHIAKLDKVAGEFQHTAAGIMIVAYEKKTGKSYLLMSLQRKRNNRPESQWDNTLALFSGKREKMPKPEQKDDPNYAALVAAAKAEEHSPSLTAVRETHEESLGSLTKEQITEMIGRPSTIAFTNNALKRYLDQIAAGADPTKLDKPFVVVTFVCVQEEKGDLLEKFKAVVENKQAPPVADSYDGAGLAWVELSSLLPAERNDGSPFFAQVFVQNQNYVVPDNCSVHAVIRTGFDTTTEIQTKGGFIIASYVARTLAAEYDRVLKHVQETFGSSA